MSDATEKKSYDKWFTPAAAFETEGARVGVATCKFCGAAVLLDVRDDFNPMQRHVNWHYANGEKL
jgi:hypothetical protein